MNTLIALLIGCIFSYLIFTSFTLFFLGHEIIATAYQKGKKKITLPGIGYVLKRLPELIIISIAWPFTLIKIVQEKNSYKINLKIDSPY